MRLSYKGDTKLNWLLMYLAGNYCDSDNSSASPGGVVLQRFYKRDHKSDHKIQ